MVSVHLEGSTFVINIVGFHKLLALKSQFAINASNVVNVKIAPMKMCPQGLRFPGTSVPGIIAAGTYLVRGKKEFGAEFIRMLLLKLNLRMRNTQKWLWMLKIQKLQ
jgi:hypothetical protein